MTITIQTTVKKNVEIPVPSFWKDPFSAITEWIGLLDEKTIVKVWDYPGNRSFIENSIVEGRESDIAKYYDQYQLSTEAEFFEAFERVYASLSLKPELAYDGPDTNNPINIVLP